MTAEQLLKVQPNLDCFGLALFGTEPKLELSSVREPVELATVDTAVITIMIALTRDDVNMSFLRMFTSESLTLVTRGQLTPVPFHLLR